MSAVEPVDDAALREDIRELGEILGEVIREQWGEDLFRLEEDVRLASRRARTASGNPGQEGVIERLAGASIADALSLVRAFTVYFHLANTAEQHHRIGDSFLASEQTAEQVLERAAASGMQGDDIARLASHLRSSPVFTAHPTEAARRSVLQKLRALDAELGRWRDSAASEREQGRARARVAELIEGLVQTNELREQRIGPVDEEVCLKVGDREQEDQAASV